MFRVLMLSVFGAVLASCATDRDAGVNEYLDPETAVTIRAVVEPSVYAHDAPELAANVRDYLSAGVVEVNNMGKRSYYLALVSWSTIDRNQPGAGPTAIPGRIELTVGKTIRELAPVTHDARRIGIGLPLFRPPSGYAGESWYVITAGDIRALAGTPPSTIDLVEEPTARVSYSIWREAGTALEAFVRDIPPAITGEQVKR